MVWIHGGAYVAGGGEEAWYEASRLADEGNIVTVTVTYRLGVFGYLHADKVEDSNVGMGPVGRAEMGSRQHSDVRGRPRMCDGIRTIGRRTFDCGDSGR